MYIRILNTVTQGINLHWLIKWCKERLEFEFKTIISMYAVLSKQSQYNFLSDITTFYINAIYQIDITAEGE